MQFLLKKQLWNSSISVFYNDRKPWWRRAAVWAPEIPLPSVWILFATAAGAHPASYPMATGNFSPGLKRSGRESDHSPPQNTEIKNMWIYISSVQ
jgi:hypothetical protein